MHAALVDHDGIIQNIIVINSEDQIPTGYVKCSESLGIGSNITDTVDELLAAKVAKQSEIVNNCRQSILLGFYSDALGSNHWYPSSYTDQLNLSSSILSSLLPGVSDTWTTVFWCSADKIIWEFKPHTASQIQKVGIDAKASVISMISKKEELLNSIRSASTIESVSSIVWI